MRVNEITELTIDVELSMILDSGEPRPEGLILIVQNPNLDDKNNLPKMNVFRGLMQAAVTRGYMFVYPCDNTPPDIYAEYTRRQYPDVPVYLIRGIEQLRALLNKEHSPMS